MKVYVASVEWPLQATIKITNKMNVNSPIISCLFSPSMYVLKRNGRKEGVHFDKITSRITKLSYGLNPDHVDPVHDLYWFVCRNWHVLFRLRLPSVWLEGCILESPQWNWTRWPLRLLRPWPPATPTTPSWLRELPCPTSTSRPRSRSVVCTPYCHCI